jgi:hypothetical protein
LLAYELVRPPFSLKFDHMSKLELQAYSEWFHASIPGRIQELERAVRSSEGFGSWSADGTPESLNDLGQWFAAVASTRERTEAERQAIIEGLVFPVEIGTRELTDETYSVAFDVGVYLSRVLMHAHPALRWQQHLRGKAFIDYGQPVLVEFRTAPFNPVRMMVVVAWGLVDGTYDGGQLPELFEIWSSQVRTEDRGPGT